MKKNVKGITLVSMVITIIVMLILAGVSISMVTGDNGVVTRASEGSVKTQLASVESDVGLSITSNQSDYFAAFAESTAKAGNKIKYLKPENLNKYCSTVKLLYGSDTLKVEGTTIKAAKFTNSGALTDSIDSSNASDKLSNGSSASGKTTSGYKNYAFYFSDGPSGTVVGTNLYVVAVHFENGFFVIDDVGVIGSTSTATVNQGELITDTVKTTLETTLGVEWLNGADLVNETT